MNFDPDEFLRGFWAKHFGASPPEIYSAVPLRSIGTCKLKNCPKCIVLDSDSDSAVMDEGANSSNQPMDIDAAARNV